MSELNLDEAMKEITRNYAQKIADMEDSAVYAYLKGAIELLDYSNKDITKYALIRVSSPMQYKNGKYHVDSQWRIVPITDLELIPEYED